MLQEQTNPVTFVNKKIKKDTFLSVKIILNMKLIFLSHPDTYNKKYEEKDWSPASPK